MLSKYELTRAAIRALPRRRFRLGRYITVSIGVRGPRAVIRPVGALSIQLAPGRKPVIGVKLPVVGRLILPASGFRMPGRRTMRRWTGRVVRPHGTAPRTPDSAQRPQAGVRS